MSSLTLYTSATYYFLKIKILQHKIQLKVLQLKHLVAKANTRKYHLS